MLHKPPSFCGTLYASSFDLLDKEISQCFLHAEGPGALPGQRTARRTLGILVPEGRYSDVGYVGAWAHRQLGESVFPEVFVVLGRGGQRDGFFTFLFSGWETPFGVVQVHLEVGHTLLHAFPGLRNDYASFGRESAIEVQLPFLQYCHRDKLRELQFLPLLVQSKDYDACAQLGEALAELQERYRLCVVASCNLYGDEVDAALVDALKRLDTKEVRDILHLRSAPGDFLVFAEAMKNMFTDEGKLLCYRPGAAALSYLAREKTS